MIEKLATILANPKKLIHFAHGKPGVITPSLAELFDTNPKEAARILREIQAKGFGRHSDYLDVRKAVEDYMRSRLPTIGISQKYPYPTYAIVQANRPSARFGAEEGLMASLDELKDRTSFTIGDSFPALRGRTSPGIKQNRAPYGSDVINLEELRRLDGKGRLETQLNTIRSRPATDDYVEAQIWEDPKILQNIFKKHGSLRNNERGALTEKLANDIARACTEKLALNVMKARGLAKSVGLIPQAGSDWKWALRNMRAANPTGAKNAPLMQSGRELAQSKQQMGALANNDMQKLRSGARRVGENGAEVGINDKGKLQLGEIGGIKTAPGSIRAHTHPGVGRIRTMTKQTNPEAARMLDPVMAASPSGWINTRGQLPSSRQAVQQRGKAVSEVATSSNISRDEAAKYMQQIGTTPSMMGAAKTISPTMSKMGPLQAQVTANPNMKLPWRGDIGTFANRGGINNIVTPTVQGVHKVNPKHNGWLRSVYFQGGYAG